MKSSRRSFLVQTPLFVLAVATAARGAVPAEVRESDADAKALGYVTDASRVDRSKYAQYSPPQQCANCQLFQPSADAKDGTCSILGGRRVPAAAWCSGYQAAM